ncbi:hypothetical protein [Novosphingobium sp. 9]|uniref:hypothetical protein n=1 Tax=Novosphingobium sp. 9 TaxID=2025349 RepID=UPI0021B55172|nr:hypothetical protein [Novosphingobium sp. 9]
MRAAQAAGTGHSIRSLVSGGASIARMLEETCPDTMLQRLAQADVSERFGPVSIQLCMFGGLARSASWIDSVAHGKLRLHHNQSGFKVVV